MIPQGSVFLAMPEIDKSQMGGNMRLGQRNRAAEVLKSKLASDLKCKINRISSAMSSEREKEHNAHGPKDPAPQPVVLLQSVAVHRS